MDIMKEKNEKDKRLKEWLKQKRENNQAKSFNRTSHYSRDICY